MRNGYWKKTGMGIAALLGLVLGCMSGLYAAKPANKLYAGPVVGSVTAHSARVMIAYKGQGNNILMLGDTINKRIIYPERYEYIKNESGVVALTMDFEKLDANTWYNIFISIDGWGTQALYGFKTQDTVPSKDVSFLFGSCSLLLNGAGRIAFPGFSHFIFQRMKKKAADFMLWGGDNIYYFGKDYESGENMFNRNLLQRKRYKKLNALLATMPQYAIWDDHDFGPNNADSSFALKETALQVFQHFWPNTYPDQKTFKGNYFSYRYYDCEFFMTDGRFHRSKPGDSTSSMLGATQMTWLKKNLITSDAAFKFIVVGSQVIDEADFGEYYEQFPKERDELLRFITENNIPGVVFLTGDKHFTELTVRQTPSGYSLYDFTCSPLTSPPIPLRLLGLQKNQQRVDGFEYNLKNFSRVSVRGNPGDRMLHLEVFSRRGNKVWEYKIPQSQLRNQSK